MARLLASWDDIKEEGSDPGREPRRHVLNGIGAARAKRGHREEAWVSYEVRVCSSTAELREAVRPIWHYFGRSTPTEEQANRVGRVVPLERAHAAWEGGRAVGGASALPFMLTVPGGRIRAAGITAVGVLPTHRRRGVLRALMRAQ